MWSVQDGWEPLCAFLEVDVPEAQFPRLNDSKMFIDRIVDGVPRSCSRSGASAVAR